MYKTTNYRRGAEKERRIVKYFRDRGKLAVRSAGSHSLVDVWVVDKEAHVIKLIQAKLGKLGKKERARLIDQGSELNGLYVVEFQLWD